MLNTAVLIFEYSCCLIFKHIFWTQLYYFLTTYVTYFEHSRIIFEHYFAVAIIFEHNHIIFEHDHIIFEHNHII